MIDLAGKYLKIRLTSSWASFSMIVISVLRGNKKSPGIKYLNITKPL